MKMTFNEYDEMMDKFDTMSEHVCWPTPEQVNNLRTDPEKWIKFCVFLYEKNPQPSNDEEKASRKALMSFINDNLQLVDEDEMDDETKANEETNTEENTDGDIFDEDESDNE